VLGWAGTLGLGFTQGPGVSGEPPTSPASSPATGSSCWVRARASERRGWRAPPACPSVGVVPEPQDQVAEEERPGAVVLHAQGPGRRGGGRGPRHLGERGRRVQQATGPGLRRREDPAAAPQAPRRLLGAQPGRAQRV
ncbi:homeobox protein Nkx-6.3 isoform 2, partial [Daubentonia madagascariensis]